ncbi:cAMP-binding domain of CRP or a regulatory subunit of cAMP-dependent protein kinases [Chryseobacterium taichungense]|uniref:cAMP-binding domain of CRP or a regulatory subunit of cAMP-dependent protein kinases n=1 Tax=Chryseobacterium taichungense TaxID=295069 RepID=A0A1H7XPM5_9FLAO|nr:Crp/Fnr family transcriptional regulator [Chryseobacterium taichungense]SEM35583.1 cAMP-binding domain of CRP or a regulatory subunit of cAMP-dependent protein kinases [Chryseobacterium taichungense]
MKTISCMNIDPEILYKFGAENKSYNQDEIIYREGDHAAFYYQIIKGKIKLNSYNEEGKEFIHNIIGEKQSFGDSLLFIEKFYVMNAICLTATEMIRLPKNNFLELLQNNPQISLEMNACLSQRLYFKAIMLQNMSSQNPAVRLEGLLNYLKSYHDGDCEQCFPVELTRQQIANLTGLRVETVIRTLKKMEKEGKLKIKDRKILY